MEHSSVILCMHEYITSLVFNPQLSPPFHFFEPLKRMLEWFNHTVILGECSGSTLISTELTQGTS